MLFRSVVDATIIPAVSAAADVVDIHAGGDVVVAVAVAVKSVGDDTKQARENA